MNPRLPLLVLAGATLLALTGCQASAPGPATSGPAPATGGTTAVVTAVATPAATPTAAATAEPAPTKPAPTKPAATKPVPAEPAADDDGCPVTAAALQKVVDLPKGWRIQAKSIECSHGWAQAAVTAPTPEEQGDGVVLFSYNAATGSWVDKGQGSSVDCGDYGIPERAGRNLSVCFYED
jgi:hypothetical protein